MPSIPRIVIGIGLALLVVGAASGGFGLYQQSTDTCETTYRTTLHTVSGNQTTSSTAEHVAYSNLSPDEQRVFRELVRSYGVQSHNGSLLLQLSQKVVTYRGKQYQTGPVSVSDCSHPYVIFEVGSVLITLLGGVVVIGVSIWEKSG